MLQPGTNVSYVCVGDEWHRFPSSFHLPHPAYRLAFVKSGFHGLLPRPFDIAQVGSYHSHSRPSQHLAGKQPQSQHAYCREAQKA